MDFSRLDRNRVLLGGIGSILLIVSILFLPWYSLGHTVSRDPASQSYDPSTFICGTGNYSCTGFETFPILRWLLLAGALAPLILAWIIVRGHKLSWAPGEMTMIVGFVAMVADRLQRPDRQARHRPAGDRGRASTTATGSRCSASIAIAATGFLRSQVGQKRERKAPGTV